MDAEPDRVSFEKRCVPVNRRGAHGPAEPPETQKKGVAQAAGFSLHAGNRHRGGRARKTRAALPLRRIDELRDDAKLITGRAHATLEQVANVELLGRYLRRRLDAVRRELERPRQQQQRDRKADQQERRQQAQHLRRTFSAGNTMSATCSAVHDREVAATLKALRRFSSPQKYRCAS